MRDIERILYYEAYIVLNPKRMEDLTRVKCYRRKNIKNYAGITPFGFYGRYRRRRIERCFEENQSGRRGVKIA